VDRVVPDAKSEDVCGASSAYQSGAGPNDPNSSGCTFNYTAIVISAVTGGFVEELFYDQASPQ
jgi:hypothetical protein